ncbi:MULTISPECIES: hypothetical protein [Bacteria]|uniref:hypothetical protein n=1 Tax=Bacteria TaxID=2 RepID=UPI003C7D3BA2
MWIRQAFLSWLFPAVAVLPLWLLVGWGVFQAGGWAFLWVLFIAIPSVLVGELVLSLLVRARPTVRRERAASWQDVLGFGAWHALTIALGFFPRDAFGWLLTATIAVFLVLFWSTLWQLWRDVTARGAAGIVLEADATRPSGFGDPEEPARGHVRQHGEVIVVTETGRSGEA